jgi:hypothetical protein
MGPLEASFKDIYWTLGSYDIVAVLEAPDDESATLRCSRSLLRTTTLRAFGHDERRGSPRGQADRLTSYARKRSSGAPICPGGTRDLDPLRDPRCPRESAGHDNPVSRRPDVATFFVVGGRLRAQTHAARQLLLPRRAPWLHRAIGDGAPVISRSLAARA